MLFKDTVIRYIVTNRFRDDLGLITKLGKQVGECLTLSIFMNSSITLFVININVFLVHHLSV